jgi:N-acetylglucosamine-6-phosphate deacetylase
MIALTANRLYTPLEIVDRPIVLIEDQNIIEVTSQSARDIPHQAKIYDFPESILAPGFIDIHIHGGAGRDVMEDDPGGLPAVQQILLKHGVTSFFPTTVTAPFDKTLLALDRLATAIETAEAGALFGSHRATPRGIHLEGPFISHQCPGVHPPDLLLRPTLQAFEQFWQAARGRIRFITIAPELEGAHDVMKEATKRGVTVSLGHSNASLADAVAGVEAGGTHFTNPNLSADIIADGIHLDPVMVKLFLRAKGPHNTVLITDANSATGMPDGTYRLGSLEVELKEGKCMANGVLAGSVLTMDVAVRNVMKFGDWDLQLALRAATLNPARVSRLAQAGRLQAGAEADVVVLSPAGKVITTIVRGHVEPSH